MLVYIFIQNLKKLLRMKYKQGKIDKRTFENRVNMLKKLKKRCKTKSKFEEKYKEYKKSTNNIPPYSVSE